MCHTPGEVLPARPSPGYPHLQSSIPYGFRSDWSFKPESFFQASLFPNCTAARLLRFLKNLPQFPFLSAILDLIANPSALGFGICLEPEN
jgi:hypothetical protein